MIYLIITKCFKISTILLAILSLSTTPTNSSDIRIKNNLKITKNFKEIEGQDIKDLNDLKLANSEVPQRKIKKTVLDIIGENENLSSFSSYLRETELDRILEKKLPWNWTIFAPSNKAFNLATSQLKSEILNDDFLSKNLLMDHIMAGQTTSDDIGSDVSTQVTVSNKPLQIYKRKDLYVKDMVVVEENLLGNNGVVHVIDCFMYVQPSTEDSRLTKETQDDFPITSCCMINSEEIISWKKSTKNKF